MHYIYESPHKDRSIRSCVTVMVISLHSHYFTVLFLTNGLVRKAQFVLITFYGATKHQLTFVHKCFTGRPTTKIMLGNCSQHLGDSVETQRCLTNISAFIKVH